jgi:hypothetical protein
LFAHFLSFGREYELLEVKDVSGASSSPVGIGQLWEKWREMGILEGWSLYLRMYNTGLMNISEKIRRKKKFQYFTKEKKKRVSLSPFLEFQLSRIPDSFHRSQSKPTPTGALTSPLISRISNNSYSLPNAR